jgi:nicotinamide mononucleotide adenylyltransferase
MKEPQAKKHLREIEINIKYYTEKVRKLEQDLLKIPVAMEEERLEVIRDCDRIKELLKKKEAEKINLQEFLAYKVVEKNARKKTLKK